MCRHSWHAWFAACGATFTYLEWRAYYRGCHRTLSRELRAWLRCKQHPWSALVFIALGAWMAHHLHELKELS
jgi:hypothetical protein